MNKTPITLSEFDGPFDVLLGLIDSKEMSISDISLSHVTEQFLAYFDTLEEEQPEKAADFLTVAARLLLMKSSLLLPQFAVFEEDDGPTLKDQLALYKQYVQASKALRELWEQPNRTVFRVEPVRKSEAFVWPTNVSTIDLQKYMVQLVKQLAPPKPLPQTSIDKTQSLKETIRTIRQTLSKKGNSLFWEHVDRKNKTSVIVGFLALLELVKTQDILVNQAEAFTDIAISKS